MRKHIMWIFACLATLAGCTTMGFDPRHDAALAQVRAIAPQSQPAEDLRKQDPRASLSLQTDPALGEGYMVLSISVPTPYLELSREIIDQRQTYARYVATKIETTGGAVNIILQCKPGKPECTDVSDVATAKVPLHRKVWRAGVYGADGRVERLLDAVYRPLLLQRFVVLVPLSEWPSIIGKEVRVLSAYGDFAITRDGGLQRLRDGEVAVLASGTARMPVKYDDLVRMSPDTPGGKYFLQVLSSEFPLPAPFHSGVVHPDLYLGAAKLTREENVLDCWTGRNGGGTIVITPVPLQTTVTFVGSLLWNLPRVASRDCGVHTSVSQGKDERKEATSGSLPSDSP